MEKPRSPQQSFADAGDHFDDRKKIAKNGFRSGKISPTNSAHGSLTRHSIRKLADSGKARKVRFYRNGDRFYKGYVMAINCEKFRSFNSLLEELTYSPLCDTNILTKGVRYIFALDGSMITTLEQLMEDEHYVCSSFDVFRNIDYKGIINLCWNPNVKGPLGGEYVSNQAPSCGIEDSREFVKPKLVTIIRNGCKPRKAVRVLLNRKTAHSFQQVLSDITNAIHLDSGSVRKIFTLDGRQVNTLADFFLDDTVFIAYGSEKYSRDDFDLDEGEEAANNFRSPSNSRNTSRTASPRPRRKALSESDKTCLNGQSEETIQNYPLALTNKYGIRRLIGEGNFAVVRECWSRSTNTRYALKIIDKTKCLGNVQMIENEVSILRKAKHPNIIRLIEEFDSPDQLFLVMELVKGGDLFELITTATKYTERTASRMTHNLLSALAYLHAAGIVHRDVKPENLLVCEMNDGTKALKLGDFGLATDAKQPLFVVCGTPTYVAPDILSEKGYGLKVDVWAAGVITYILLCGFPPFVSPSNNQEELFDKILSGKFEFISPFWDEVSSSAKDLIEHMLQVDPEMRYSAAEVLDHPWVANDTAKDDKLHVARELNQYFTRTKKPKGGLAVIASTALDKGSKFFRGRGAFTVHPKQDEVF
ncbi:serine/threonine-protein kinase DCLK2 isoform X3 [Octopus bimaculoides]|uniref:serine/threonine-protein kinase DCLK2 isoform X3 n=1 Tax=Octopus bimaculoides TaxID=37653 RepID=UPI0022E32F1D|nr:serine/threonine-protein kinase DCLK2 isoform X3 [Octopus bimaculoides]